jgi:AcrR family transcriptional regulator
MPKKRAKRRPARADLRTPTQARAVRTVDAIVDAARVLIVRRGLEATTTNAIAERAGVSIGSLYQYFEGRDAIVTELLRRHVQQALELIFAVAEGPFDDDLEGVVRRLIRAIIDVHRRDPELHRIADSVRPVLVARPARMEQVAPTSTSKPSLVAVHEQVMGVAVRFLARHRAEIVVDDLERAAFVAVTTVDALTHQALMTWPELLDDPQLELDATRLILGYLTGRVPPLAAGDTPPGS